MKIVLSLLIAAEISAIAACQGRIFGEDTLTLKATGDIVPYSNYPPGKFVRPASITNLLDAAIPYLSGADIVVGNFEGPITVYQHSSKDMTKSKYLIAFRYPPVETEALIKRAGFNIAHIANNHDLDFGIVGMDNTIMAFKKVGVDCVGLKDEILYKKLNNIRVAVIGFNYVGWVYNSMYETDNALKLVGEAKTNADIVVITVHAGGEGADHCHVTKKEEIFLGEHRGDIYNFSHKMIDAGADCVIAFSPHVLRGMEMYRGHVIAYSLGNFIGYGGESNREGVLANSAILVLNMTGTGEFLSGRIIPMRISENGIPVYDDKYRSVAFIKGLSDEDFPESGMEIDTNGEFVKK